MQSGNLSSSESMQAENRNSPESASLGLLFNSEEGLLTISGNMLELIRHLDTLFRQWASVVSAIEYAFPPVLSVRSLDLVDYFNSFPHLTTVATEIDSKDGGLEQFIKSARKQPITEIDTQHLAPARYVLPSAACYAIYNHFRGIHLEHDLYITTCCPCSRRENTYKAGERQWMFQMREIVCIGRLEAVKDFLDTYRVFLTDKLQEAGMPFTIAKATDPFFDRRDPRILMQQLDSLKYEILYRETLAISSLNFHRNFFGERFEIKDKIGGSAFSGCVAFGLERWLTSCVREYGQNLDNWPEVFR